jgi:anti-anti-sigma factor
MHRHVPADGTARSRAGVRCDPREATLVVVSQDDDFKVELESHSDDVLTVRLDGELDMAHAEWVEDTLGAAGAHHRQIAVQLDELSFLDSAGIRVLQSLKAQGEELGITVSFQEPSDVVRRALAAAGLTDLAE